MNSLCKSRPLRTAIALAAGVGLATATIAQTVADQSIPDTGLNIPKNLQIFGKRDPNVRKATAIVNETVITGTDVDHRVNLILAANTLKLNEQELATLRLQVLGSLIDETLELQEAKTAEIKVGAEEIDQRIALIAKNFNKTVPEFRAFLRAAGSSERSLRRQVEAELAWNRYLRRRIGALINVGDAEVKSILARLEAQKGQTEFHVKEIYLRASPEQQSQIFAETRALMEEIQKGKRSFEEVARDRSEATTRVVGGDLGWVKADQLPETLAQASVEMSVNQLAGPIETPGGFSILYLVDKRKVLTADARDAVLSLRQVSIAFPKGITEAEASQRVSTFASAIKTIRGCGEVQKVAASLQAEVVDNDAVKIRDLPVPLQEMISRLSVGEATPPFGSPTDGVRTLVVCGRTDPQAGDLPGMEAMRSQMEQHAINLRADHKLRDLRRDAIIEYR
ncbi:MULTISPECIES: peptidylprolyl isomerase [Sphingomonas]|uniref:peptidylprolyl isomerase n=1 Tax=Sphingomonas sp. CCH10-B3 TaxID=1768757 RepID=UPI000836BB69|nr:peptidylprolyl isomerase [Sphingomonas sp. CCH10-B3]